MKCAAILTVAVALMMGQGAECLLGGLLGGNGNVAASVFANLNVLNLVDNLDVAIEAGAIARARVQAILGLNLDAFVQLWVLVDADGDGELNVDELVDLELMLYIEGLLNLDANTGGLIDIDITLGGSSADKCRSWVGKVWKQQRGEFLKFFSSREELKKRIQRRRRGGDGGVVRRGNILA